MNEIEWLELLKGFTEGKDFELNPDSAHVEFIVKGVFALEKTKGLKYCPCRLTSGDKQKDLELLCPCNFKIQEAWSNWGRCWCGLFVKRKS
ncbi:MAG: ferredoxin-thioredoxin reductase catalytic domain-containing protein [Candidatus Micrarchaeia archaeon]